MEKDRENMYYNTETDFETEDLKSKAADVEYAREINSTPEEKEKRVSRAKKEAEEVEDQEDINF